MEHGALTESEVEELRESTLQALERLRRHPITEKTRDTKTVLLQGPVEDEGRLPFMLGVREDEIERLVSSEHDKVFEDIFVPPHTNLFVKGNFQAFPKGAKKSFNFGVFYSKKILKT